MVGLEPRRLVGGQGEGGGVRLAEAEGREGLEDLPDPVDVGRVVAPGQRRGRHHVLDLGLPAGDPSARRTSSASARVDAGRLGDEIETCSWKTTTPSVSWSAGTSDGWRYRAPSSPASR